jgi:hypothetical protein
MWDAGYDANQLLLNADVIAVDQQDTAGNGLVPPKLLSTDGNGNQIWGRELQNGDYVFVLDNTQQTTAQSITLTFTNACWGSTCPLNNANGYYVKDLWAHTSDGALHTSYTASSLAYGASAMIQVSTHYPFSSAPTVPATYPPHVITAGSLSVNDTANASNWSIQNTNFSEGINQFGDRSYQLSVIPTSLRGMSWIRSANSSKSYQGTTLATFSISQGSNVYVAVDTRYIRPTDTRPAWLTDGTWTDTGLNFVNSESPTKTFEIYYKWFNSGSVSLGALYGTYDMYTVIVPNPVNVTNLVVNDTANASHWYTQGYNLWMYDWIYGDAGYRFWNTPLPLFGASWIETAINSRSYSGNTLATFSINQQATVYVAIDTRVTTLPSWVDGTWTAQPSMGYIDNENPLRAFNVYSKVFSSGTVSLGPLNNSSVSMYSVFVQ